MSAVDVRIGDDWHYNLSDWSVVGDSTPLIAGDTTGGAGALSFTAPETADSRMLHGKPVVLRDPHSGETTGDLGLGGGNGVNATITGFSKLDKLNVTRTAEAYSGTLRGAILYYLSLCGITTNISVSTAISGRSVRYIGWEGNVLDRIKDLCAAQQMTVSLIGARYVFRSNKQALISSDSFADWTWKADENQLAQAVEVAWYDTQAPKAQMVYPAGGWRDDLQVFSVDAGEVAEYEIDLTPSVDVDGSYGFSATSIVQPVAIDAVPREYAGTNSVYAVSGKDNLPIKAAQWTASGGSMSLELVDGGSRIKVRIVGSSEGEYGPFQISMTAADGDYSSLRIYGAGMLYQRSTLKWATGLDGDRAPQEVAPIVDNPFLGSREAAAKAGGQLLSRHSSAVYTISGTVGEIRTLVPNTQAFFDGEVIEQDPAKHSFGNLEGSYFVADGSVYRVRSVTYTPNGATFTAEQHASQALLTAGFEILHGISTMTADEFNAFYPAGITADQLSAAPLIGPPIGPLPPQKLSGYGHGPYGSGPYGHGPE